MLGSWRQQASIAPPISAPVCGINEAAYWFVPFGRGFLLQRVPVQHTISGEWGAGDSQHQRSVTYMSPFGSSYIPYLTFMDPEHDTPLKCHICPQHG